MLETVPVIGTKSLHLTIYQDNKHRSLRICIPSWEGSRKECTSDALQILILEICTKH